MTTIDIPNLSASQWEYVFAFRNKTNSIEFNNEKTLNALFEKGLVEKAQYGWRSGVFTEKARQLVDQILTIASQKGKLPKQLRNTIAQFEPAYMIDDQDTSIRHMAVIRLTHVDDEIMNRLAHDPDMSIRFRMAQIASNDQTRFFDDETSVDVLAELGERHYLWVDERVETFIASDEPKLHSLVLRVAHVTRTLLDQLIAKHLIDEQIVSSLYVARRDSLPDRIQLTDDELLEIIQHGTGDAQSRLYSRRWNDERLQRLIDDTVIDDWCEHGDADILKELVFRDDVDHVLTAQRLDMIVNRHLIDGYLMQYVIDQLTDAQIESIIRVADQDTLEQIGNRRRPFTHTMVHLLAGKSRVFDNRMESFVHDVNRLFTTPFADMSTIMNQYARVD